MSGENLVKFLLGTLARVRCGGVLGSYIRIRQVDGGFATAAREPQQPSPSQDPSYTLPPHHHLCGFLSPHALGFVSDPVQLKFTPSVTGYRWMEMKKIEDFQIECPVNVNFN